MHLNIWLKIVHVIVLLFVIYSTKCNGFSPFKNRGSAQTTNTFTTHHPNIKPTQESPSFDHLFGGHNHHSYDQHTTRPLASHLFNDKHHLYQTLGLSQHHYQQQHQLHHQHQHHHDQSLKRQNRNRFEVVYEWRQIDFEYPTFFDRQRAILSGDFIPSNNIPFGIDRWRNRIFVTIPRLRQGIPASLASLSLPSIERSPPLRPYPSWEWHANPDALQPDCSRLMSVYRTWIDECERIWVLDAGTVNASLQMNQICPPKIIAFDLRTDQPLFSYELPIDQVKEDSLHSNLIVDVRNGRCQDAYAYITDVWRFGLVVFSLARGRSWRTRSHFYMPDPDACDYRINNVNFQWIDGVFGISLSPMNDFQDRFLFFHPLSSFGEFIVSTSVLRNETAWTVNNGLGLSGAFIRIGERGARGQSSTSAIDRNNVQFFNLVQQNAIGCWNTNTPYFSNSLDVVHQDNSTLIFPNDLKIDQEVDQNVWVLSNRLPVYLYSQLNLNDVNFRIQRANVREIVVGTTCDSSSLRFSSILDEFSAVTAN